MNQEPRDGSLTSAVTLCLLSHFKQGLRRFLCDLRRDRVWFFALYPDQIPEPSMMYLGTCASVARPG